LNSARTLPVLDASIAMLGRHLGYRGQPQVVCGQHALDQDYFRTDWKRSISTLAP